MLYVNVTFGYLISWWALVDTSKQSGWSPSLYQDPYIRSSARTAF